MYKVGGCVRDRLLGHFTNDIDFTFVLEDTSISVESGFQQMEDILATEGFEIFLSTPTMFTVRAKFPKNHKFAGLVADFVMARKEVGYVPGTRRPILELGSLEDDLVRRDFTLNALAEDEDGNVIDLFDGVGDLEAKLLRTPLSAEITMMDDPLRILRALRFSITKGFVIDWEIWEAMKQPEILNRLKTTVSGERVREEVMKMMKFDTVKTLKLFCTVDNVIPSFTEFIFGTGMWLKPTFEKK